MGIKILRFTCYTGSKGNAVAFADVEVRTDAGVFRYEDMKLYRRGKAGLAVSPKQIKTEHGWAFAYVIPEAFYPAIREALIERYEMERVGQLALL